MLKRRFGDLQLRPAQPSHTGWCAVNRKDSGSGGEAKERPV